MSKAIPVNVIDCDVHPHVASAEYAHYVPEPWRSRYFSSHFAEVDLSAGIYFPPLHGARLDAFPEGGGMPGSDPALLERQLFVEAGVDFAVLVGLDPRQKLGQPELESALCAGINEHMAETWLGKHNDHGRYRGTIRVSPFDGDGAVAEIKRWNGDLRFAQVYFAPMAEVPYGHPRFFAALKACAEQNLPVSMHVLRSPNTLTMSPVGFASYQLETFTHWPLVFMSHFASLIFEGVFDRLPDLRIVSVEGGFSWMPPFMWRMDRYWEALGRELTGAARRPSEYVKQHLRFTTQPLDEPSDPAALQEFMEWIGAEDVLLFASDYPHYDFDDPRWLLPRVPKDMRPAIAAGNAIELYGWPATRPPDRIDALASELAA